MGGKKINWLLILQGWAMLWVVIGHSFVGEFLQGPGWENELCKFAYRFHMPLFMLVSGWLFYLTRLRPSLSTWGGQKWNYSAIVKDKVVRLIVPGVVFSLIAFAVKLAIPGEVSRQAGLSLHEIGHALLYPYDNPFREFWFIATLFWFFLMTPMWKWILKRKWLMWTTIVMLIVLHFVEPGTEFLSIDRVCSNAIWFFLGLVVSKEDYVDKIFNKNAWWTLLIGVFIYCIGRFVNPFITTMGCIVFSFGLALLLDKYIPKTFFTFRNYTYQIFLMGIFAQMFVKILYRHISMPYIAAYILCILMGLYVPVLVSKLIEKINWTPLSFCVGLKPIKK